MRLAPIQESLLGFQGAAKFVLNHGKDSSGVSSILLCHLDCLDP
jgi:hypothetical protein